MSSDYSFDQYHQRQEDAPTDNSKHLPCVAQQIHPCQYDVDLGAEDSDPESQVSDLSNSQVSDLSGTSPDNYSFEEGRAESQQDVTWSGIRTVQPHGSPAAAPDRCSQRLTHDVPFRLKHDSTLNHNNTDVLTIASQQVINPVPRTAPGDTLQNERRGRSVGLVVPPALRRDTDGTDTIVRMIVLFCTNLINSIWCSSEKTSSTSTPSSANVLPLQIFITETLRRSKTSYSTLQIALYYLILLKQCLPTQNASDRSGCRAMQCGRRMFLTSLILASKYLQDRNYSARAWSKISGLPLKEINDNEKKFLGIVSWDLHVPKATFENWSKIVLQVCKRSLDPGVGCKMGNDLIPQGPGSGPNGQRQCVLQDMTKDIGALRNWWLENLRQLKTDIVKCSVRTQRYVESIAPFRAASCIPRPVSPESEGSADDKFPDLLFSQDTRNSAVLRQSSLDRSQQRFEPASDLLHPAAPLTIPPEPILENLPTPQTTPQADISGWWTPRVAHHTSRSSLRCKVSASVLGNAFRKNCPMANLETCPPPMPRPQNQAQWPCTPAEHHVFSQTSSPESAVSDISSFAPRSRSSSISSTSSWATNSSHNSGRFNQDHPGRLLRELVNTHQRVQSNICPRQQSVSRQCAPVTALSIERPRTAFKVGSDSLIDFDPVTSWCETTLVAADKYVNESDNIDEQANKRHEAAQVLVGLRVDETAVRSRARPLLSRSGTQIYNPRQEQDSRLQSLKRSLSDTFECATGLPRSVNGTPLRHVDQSPCHPQQICSMMDFFKTVQHPSQTWAEPRKPLQLGTQNKRQALQLAGSPAAVGLTGRLLKADLETHANRLGAAAK